MQSSTKSGLRISEFCGLTDSDIDFENRTINVDHQLQYSGKKSYRIETPKTETFPIAFVDTYKHRRLLVIYKIFQHNAFDFYGFDFHIGNITTLFLFCQTTASFRFIQSRRFVFSRGRPQALRLFQGAGKRQEADPEGPAVKALI